MIQIIYYALLIENVKVILTVVKQPKQLQIKPRKKSVFNGIRTHDLSDTGVMLYLLSYEASLEAGQV